MNPNEHDCRDKGHLWSWGYECTDWQCLNCKRWRLGVNEQRIAELDSRIEALEDVAHTQPKPVEPPENVPRPCAICAMRKGVHNFIDGKHGAFGLICDHCAEQAKISMKKADREAEAAKPKLPDDALCLLHSTDRLLLALAGRKHDQHLQAVIGEAALAINRCKRRHA